MSYITFDCYWNQRFVVPYLITCLDVVISTELNQLIWDGVFLCRFSESICSYCSSAAQLHCHWPDISKVSKYFISWFKWILTLSFISSSLKMRKNYCIRFTTEYKLGLAVVYLLICNQFSSNLLIPYFILVIAVWSYPCFDNPCPMNIHESPVTTCCYFFNCPSDLTPAFYSVGCRQKKTTFSCKVKTCLLVWFRANWTRDLDITKLYLILSLHFC